MGQKARTGDIVRIRLDDQGHGYARALGRAVFAFYDGRHTYAMAVVDVLKLPILFTIPVADSAMTKGRWLVDGNVALEPALAVPARFFMQDLMDAEKFRISQGGVIRPASRSDCAGLERSAVWTAEQVEDRLRDHYAGRPNRWCEAMKPRLV